MMKKLKAVAVAATLSALAPLAAHATAFGAGSTMSFYFSDTVIGLEGPSLTIGVSGAGQLITDGGTTVLGASAPGAALDLTGTNLNTWTGGSAGITLSGNGTTIDMNSFAYATATKQLTFQISINGAAPTAGAFQVYSCTGLFCTPGTQSTAIPFDASNPAAPTGQFLATKLRLTSASATTIATALGMASSASTLTSVDFGNMAIEATAAVPEPSTYALLGLGLGVAGFVARRRAAV